MDPTDALLFLSHFCLFVLVFHIYSYLYFIYLYLCFTYIYLYISTISVCISHISVCCLYFTYFYLYFTHFYLDFRFTYLCWTSTNRSSVQFPPAPSPPIKSLWQTTQQDNGHRTRGVQSTKNMNSPHEVSSPRISAREGFKNPCHGIRSTPVWTIP